MMFPLAHGLYGAEQNFSQELVNAGLDTGLELVLDAGSFLSYDGSGQTFTNLVDAGVDAHLGANATPTTDDPTFNGVSGALSSAEYFSFDGGDFFTLKSQPAWAGSGTSGGLHHDNAKWTALFWLQIAATATANGLMGTGGFGSNHHGIDLVVNSAEQLRLWHEDGDNLGSDIVGTSTTVLTTGAWHLAGVSVNEGGGAGASFFFEDDTTNTFDGAYLDPKVAAASFTLAIGRTGDTIPVANGYRIAGVMIWSTNLTTANCTVIWNAQRGRFGL